MSPEEYINERVDEQIGWYDRKSQHAQKWFKRLRIIEVIAAVSIPFAAGLERFSYTASWSFLIVGLLGMVVAVLSTIISLSQYQENWIEYRTTCESIKHEKFLFLTNTEPYGVENPFALFVQRVENLISRENSAWSQYSTAAVENTKLKAD